MFMVPAKTLIVESLRRVFGPQHPQERFRGISVSIEYPLKVEDYPGIWVDFAPSNELQSAGIGHRELEGGGAQRRSVRVWRFNGMIQLTCVALTSRQRDELYDELITLLAFGGEDPGRAVFRHGIEHNDLIGMSPQWDRFSTTGKAETPGTPWDTNEVVYEITVALDAQGEFRSDGSAVLAPSLSGIELYPREEGEPEDPEAAGEDPPWI